MNWPGHIKPGVVQGLSHVVDMYPTLAAIAGAKLETNKPLDGMNLCPAISQGTKTPREEVVYNIDPMRGAIREGDMKPVWQAGLPGKVELFDIAKDPGETVNFAAQKPELVTTLQERIDALSSEIARRISPWRRSSSSLEHHPWRRILPPCSTNWATERAEAAQAERCSACG